MNKKDLQKAISLEAASLKAELKELEKQDKFFKLTNQVRSVRSLIFYSHTVAESGLDFLIGRYIIGNDNSGDGSSKPNIYLRMMGLLHNIDFYRKIKFAEENKLFEDNKRLRVHLIALNNYRNELAHLANFGFVKYKHPVLQLEPLRVASRTVNDIKKLLTDKKL